MRQVVGLSHSTVVLYIGIAMGAWSSIIAIRKEILVFAFSFNLNHLSSKDIKVENMQKTG